MEQIQCCGVDMRILISIFTIIMLSACASAQGLVINEAMSANVNTIADEDDDYPDWLEIFNPGDSLVNLDGYGLSDDESEPFKWIVPQVEIPAGDYLFIFASGKDRTNPFLHANFKIKSSGETLILTNPSGETVDQIETGFIPSDISKGRQPDGGLEWYFFAEPTPRSSNSTQGYPGISQPPDFSPPGGFFTGIVSLTLEAPSPQAIIHYTVDGSPPSDSSQIYTSPIIINSTIVIRARAFEPGLLYSSVETHSYIFYDNNNLTVISLSTDPDNLWDDDYGIYVLGSHPGPPPEYFNANFFQDWERPVHIEFFEPDGSVGFSLDSGVKIHGGWSRRLPQKSLAVFTRDKYCCDIIDYQIFPGKPIVEFQSIVLRNSGEDWLSTMMRDAFMTGLVDDTDVDIQAYRPSILFLNGQYWGIHNIREKMNEHYLASNRGVDPDNIDLLEHKGSIVIIEGDAEHYAALIDFIRNHDIRVMENYEYVTTQMDVFNFIDYHAAEIYYANTDWPAYNVKLWRPREPDGVWKWMLHDTDGGFGLYHSPYILNSLALTLQPNLNFPLANFLLISLLENDSFRVDFINHFADLLNVNFHPDTVIETIEAISGIIEPEMPAHINRWRGTIERWYEELDVLDEFAEHRVDCVRVHIQEEFNLEGIASVTLDVDPLEAGKIKINTKTIGEYPWDGVYFLGVPIQLTALPENGFRFNNWIGAEPPDSISISIYLTGDISVTALFEIDTVSAGSIIITEINYHSSDNFDPGDWVEFYNDSCESVDISGWIFKDENDDHIFIFPPNMVLEPEALIVLCRDTAAFSGLFPEVNNYLGDFDFGLSNGGELIRLFDNQENIIDSLTYDDEPPWPTEPDGNGPTLELIDPSLPNEDPENWRASTAPHGSPGQQNGWSLSPVGGLIISFDNNNLILDWSDVPESEIYYIYRSAEPHFDISNMEPHDTSTSSDYTDFGVLNEGCYYYCVTWE